MKFKNLNEASFKRGDVVFFKGDFEIGEGYVRIMSEMENGYLATHQFLDDDRDVEFHSCVWIDDNGKVFGKYPCKKYNGSLKDLEDWGTH